MLLRFVVRLLANVLILYLLDFFLDQFQVDGGFRAYLIAGIILGVVNISVKPLLNIFTFPLKVLTLGLFGLVINFIVLYLVAAILNALGTDQMHITLSGFQDYLIATVVFTLLNAIIHGLEKK